MSGNRGTNRSAEAYVVSMAPDVCKTPIGPSMVPVPYTITCKFNVAKVTARRTNFTGDPVFSMGSHLPTVQGDEPGVGGGIISGVNLGACRPVEHSKSVRVEGEWLVRHTDLMAMNCSGPKGKGNTYGRIIYIGVNPGASVGPDGEIIHQEQHSYTDSKTGETVTGTKTVSRDPETGLVTEKVEAARIDPETGLIESRTVTETTDPLSGDVLRRESSGTFDPAHDHYQWEESTTFQDGPGIEGIEDSGALEFDSERYPADTAGSDYPDSEPAYDATNDPEYQETLAEQQALEQEMAALEKEMAWEVAKAGVDAAGIVDPTPTSDLIAGAMSAAEGDFVGAGLSLISVVPWLGDALAKPVKASRAAAKMSKLAAKAKKVKDKAGKLAKKLQDLKARRKAPSKGAPSPKASDGGHVPSKRTAGSSKGPNAKKAEQLKKNKRQGQKREAEVKNELEGEGHEVVGSQVSVKTSKSRRVVDHMVRDKDTGRLRAVEVKSGGATRSSNQIAKDNAMATEGGTIIGKNAPPELVGETVRIPTEVRR